MATNKSQKDRIVGVLLKTGKISRNACLRNYISRLGAIICVLKDEGWDFRPEHEEGDYIYYTARCPIKVEQYINPITKELINVYKK
jgi:hypothetical protein